MHTIFGENNLFVRYKSQRTESDRELSENESDGAFVFLLFDGVNVCGSAADAFQLLVFLLFFSLFFEK